MIMYVCWGSVAFSAETNLLPS